MANCIWAITTCNRLDFLKQTVDSWFATRNPSYHWTVIIADDGSTDGTWEYLSNIPHPVILLQHNQRGVHYQTNRLLHTASKLRYDIGFKTDDDLLFRRAGWDKAYVNAILETGYDHLVFHDPTWRRKKVKVPTVKHRSGLLECKAHWNDTQGAFWTFTPRVLKKVGFFDLAIYGKRDLGHRDYTMRCCKAGFNKLDSIFDIVDSQAFIELNQHQYVSTWGKLSPSKKSDPKSDRKKLHLWDGRIYVPYNTLPHVKMYL